MDIDITKFEGRESIKNAPITKVVPSDTELCSSFGTYPRGILVLTGGTLTVWTRNTTGNAAVKVDFGTVPDGFIWTYGGIVGVCETDEAGQATTADNAFWIP